MLEPDGLNWDSRCWSVLVPEGVILWLSAATCCFQLVRVEWNGSETRFVNKKFYSLWVQPGAAAASPTETRTSAKTRNKYLQKYWESEQPGTIFGCFIRAENVLHRVFIEEFNSSSPSPCRMKTMLRLHLWLTASGTSLFFLKMV